MRRGTLALCPILMIMASSGQAELKSPADAADALLTYRDKWEQTAEIIAVRDGIMARILWPNRKKAYRKTLYAAYEKSTNALNSHVRDLVYCGRALIKQLDDALAAKHISQERHTNAVVEVASIVSLAEAMNISTPCALKCQIKNMKHQAGP